MTSRRMIYFILAMVVLMPFLLLGLTLLPGSGVESQTGTLTPPDIPFHFGLAYVQLEYGKPITMQDLENSQYMVEMNLKSGDGWQNEISIVYPGYEERLRFDFFANSTEYSATLQVGELFIQRIGKSPDAIFWLRYPKSWRLVTDE